MSQTLEAAQSLSQALASAGKISFQESLWTKVKDSINAEQERFFQEEKALSPTPAQLRKQFSL